MTGKEEGLLLHPSLLEKLAELEHEQWSHIIKYLLKEGCITLARMQSSDYTQLVNTPYSKLLEGQKDSDREWARKVLDVFAEHQKQVVSQIQARIDKLVQDRNRVPLLEINKQALLNTRILELEWAHFLITGETYKALLVSPSAPTSGDKKE